MIRAFTPKLIVASDLLLGETVYMTATGGWTRMPERAARLEDEADAEIRLLEAMGQPDRVARPHFADAGTGSV